MKALSLCKGGFPESARTMSCTSELPCLPQMAYTPRNARSTRESGSAYATSPTAGLSGNSSLVKTL